MALGVDISRGCRATLAAALLVAAALLLAFPSPSGAAGQGDPTPSTTLLPPVSVPPVTLPPVSLPVVTVPPLTVVPSVTVPPVTLPPFLQLPSASSPSTAPLPPTTTSAPATAAGLPSSTLPVEPAAVPPSSGTVPGQGANHEPGVPAATSASDPLPVRLRLAAAQTAERLSFPLGLAAAILAFLLVEPHIHRGDRRGFENGGHGRDDELLGFS